MFRKLIAVLLLALLTAQPAQAQTPRRVALVIANQSYANATRLANPANDGRLVGEALRAAGFGVVDVRSDLGIAGFRAALQSFQRQAEGAEVALVYFAGHGIEADGANWLIPVDAALASNRDLEYEAIRLDLVLSAVSGANVRIVALDACRNNPFGRTWTSTRRAVTRGLAPVEVDDVLVLYAAAPGQTAADGTTGNSPFATALSHRLRERGLAVQLLGGLVRDDVLAATQSQQRPFVMASMTGVPFYLLPAATGGGTSQLAALLAACPRVTAPAPGVIDGATAPPAEMRAVADAYEVWRLQIGPNLTCRHEALNRARRGEFTSVFTDVDRGIEEYNRDQDAASALGQRLAEEVNEFNARQAGQPQQ